MKNVRRHEGGSNTLDKFRDGRMELFGYRVTRIYDLVTNGN